MLKRRMPASSHQSLVGVGTHGCIPVGRSTCGRYFRSESSRDRHGYGMTDARRESRYAARTVGDRPSTADVLINGEPSYLS